MKSLVPLLILILIGCNSSSTVPPPDQLIPEEKMEEILFDLSLLKAIQNTKFKRKGDAVFNNQYLLRKYGIDSLTFAQNQLFYAQNPKLLVPIYQRIDQRLEQLLDSLRAKEKNKTIPLKRD